MVRRQQTHSFILLACTVADLPYTQNVSNAPHTMAPKAAPALFKQLNDALAGGEGADLVKGTKV
jgi:hypothetical protein